MATQRASQYKTVIVNGRELAYVAQGSGEPVIFVHGSISDLRIWDKQVAAFAENHRAIAYSRRYAWPNTEIPDGEDDLLPPHVDDLAQLIKKLDAAPAHLVGNSRGGFICLLAALSHPELVRTITVEEPPVIPLFVSTPPKPQQLLKLFATRPRTGAALMKLFGTGLGPATTAFKRGDVEGGVRIFARAVIGAEVYESLPPEIKQMMLDNGKGLSAELLGAGFPPFTDADARRITTPALLLASDKSAALFRRLVDRLQQLLPSNQRVDISNASHVMHFDQPVAVNHAVMDFIAKH